MKKSRSQELSNESSFRFWPNDAGPNLAMLAGLCFVFFLPVFLHPNKMLWASDIVRAHVEYKQVQWHSFWTWGSFPLWDPTVYCGKSIVGDPLPALLYPPAWIFWLIPSAALFGFFLWFQVTLSSWGMFLFARRKGCDSSGAFFAAVAFALGGKTGAHVFAGHVELLTTMLGLPWMFWALEGVLQRPSWRTALALGGITAFFAPGGSVQMLYWHFLFMGVYAVLWVITQASEGGIKSAIRTTGYLLGASGVFAAAAAPWWIPVVRQTLLLGARARGTDFAFSTQGSASFWDLLRFIWPKLGVPAPQILAPDPVHNFFWEASSYPGLVALCLALTAIFFLKRQGVISLAVLAFLSVILALGENSPFFWLACKVIPGFSLFRCPGRLFFYANFALAVLGGLMLTHGPTVSQKWSVALLFSFLFEGAFIGALILGRVCVEPVRGLWIPVLIGLLLTPLGFLWYSGTVKEGPWRIILLIVVIAELYAFWRPLINVVEPRVALPRIAASEFLAEQAKKEEFRIYDPTGMIEQQTAARDGLELITGYHPGISARHLDLYRKIWRSDQSDITQQFMHGPGDIACANILDIMNTTYLVAFEPDLGEGYEKVFQSPEHESPQPRFIYRRKTALPRAWLVARAEKPAEGTSVLDALCHIDPKQVCLTEDDPSEGTGPYQELVPERSSPANCTLRFKTDAAGVVVVSQAWHPDWCASDNGQKVPIRRVNHNLLGIPVQAGQHELHLWYRPWDFYLGLVFAVPAWCVLAFTGLLTHRRIRRERAST